MSISKRHRIVERPASVASVVVTILGCFISLQLSCLLSGCAQKKVQGQISTNFGWSVHDPILSRFTHICKDVELNAIGKFKKGSINFHGLKIGTQDGTSFTLALHIPITDPDRIDFGTATGSLTLSKPMDLNGLPLPQKILLEPGKASAEMDIVGGVANFLLNSITSKPATGSDGGDVGSIVDSVVISSAGLELVPGKSLDLGKLHLTIGPNSKVTLSNLKIDGDLNYTGNARAALTFEKGCVYRGEKTEFKFDGGKSDLYLQTVKKNGVYIFTLEAERSIANLLDCSYIFGKFKQCLATTAQGTLRVEKFSCRESEGNPYVELKTKSAMRLEHATLLIKNARKTFTLTSDFAQVIPAFLEVNAVEGAVSTAWWTTNTNQADKVRIDITPGRSTTSLVLGKTSIGPVDLAKEGILNFSFDKGVSQLQKLRWSNNKKSFEIDCAEGSTVSIPPNMSMSVIKDEESTKTTLPLNLQVGKATVHGANSDTELNDLKGKVILTVDNGTTLTGGMDFALVSCNLLGQNKVDVHANGLKLSNDKTGGHLSLDACKMTISNKVLSAMINEQIPNERSFEVDKTLLEKQKWRYRNAVLKNVKVSKMQVKQMVASAAGEERFTVTGDVGVDGTIEKGGMLSIIKKQHSAWDVRPWSATGQGQGAGILKYEIHPQDPLTKSHIDYQLSLDLEPAKDVDLDWSEVSDGLLSKAENSIITKFISSYDPKSYLRKATFNIFKTATKKLSNVTITKVSTSPTKDGLSVAFSAQVKM